MADPIRTGLRCVSLLGLRSSAFRCYRDRGASARKVEIQHRGGEHGYDCPDSRGLRDVLSVHGGRTTFGQAAFPADDEVMLLELFARVTWGWLLYSNVFIEERNTHSF